MTRNMITQSELHKLHRLGEEIAEAQAALAKLKKKHGALALSVTAMHDEGLPIQSGRLTIDFITKPGVRRPKWKELHQAIVGEDEAKRIIEATPPGKGRRQLVVKPWVKPVSPAATSATPGRFATLEEDAA